MKGLYRENALVDVSSPEQLNKYIRVVHPSAWVAALSVFGAVIGFLIWIFAGSVTVGADVYGIVFPEGGVVNVNATVSGYISDVRAQAGDYIQSGGLLAVIPQNDVIQEIEDLKTRGAGTNEIDAMIKEYRRRSFVLASNNGKIIRVAEENAFVNAGDNIATILAHDNFSNNQRVAAYAPFSAAKNIKYGMEAQVSPSFAPREEYGYMRGYVSSIGAYPITKEHINRNLLVFIDNVLPESGFIEVIITLLPDGDSDNLIKWSNPKGRTLSIEMGTACKVLIITNKNRPVDSFLQG